MATSASRNYLLEYEDSFAETDWTPLSSAPGDGATKTLTDPAAGAVGTNHPFPMGLDS